LLVKIGYLKEDELRRFVQKTVHLVDGYSAINTALVEGSKKAQRGEYIPAFTSKGKAAKADRVGKAGGTGPRAEKESCSVAAA
jgi:hypothetical protein